MIQVENLTKFYGNHPAIQDVSFTVEEGEIVGFLGPNGAGKTTTMRILTGFLPASSGSATVAGYDVFEDSIDARKHIGYMPETVPLYPEMTVQEYLDFFGQVRRVPKRSQRVKDVSSMCGLEDMFDARIGRLSKGYRQRVGLAQALIHDPDVLILDEPTVGLDPRQIIEVRQLIKNLAGEHTVILSTHILPEASMICQRVLIINEGRIVAEDTPDRLKNNLQGADRVQIAVRRPSPDLPLRLQKVPDVQAVAEAGSGVYEIECTAGSDRREDLAAAVIQGGWGLLELRQVTMSLEEIFLKLTATDHARHAGARRLCPHVQRHAERAHQE
jgi:gliding motility-associated transport system ATP-binding protein